MQQGSQCHKDIPADTPPSKSTGDDPRRTPHTSKWSLVMRCQSRPCSIKQVGAGGSVFDAKERQAHQVHIVHGLICEQQQRHPVCICDTSLGCRSCAGPHCKQRLWLGTHVMRAVRQKDDVTVVGPTVTPTAHLHHHMVSPGALWVVHREAARLEHVPQVHTRPQGVADAACEQVHKQPLAWGIHRWLHCDLRLASTHRELPSRLLLQLATLNPPHSGHKALSCCLALHLIITSKFNTKQVVFV
jgi:hypothetical protein